MDNKCIYLAYTIKNSICIICWTMLAIIFNHWWIALFALFFMSTLTTEQKRQYHYLICDHCGAHSPEGLTPGEAEQNRIKARWIRRKVDDKWEDICPGCQKNLLKEDENEIN